MTFEQWWAKEGSRILEKGGDYRSFQEVARQAWEASSRQYLPEEG